MTTCGRPSKYDDVRVMLPEDPDEAVKVDDLAWSAGVCAAAVRKHLKVMIREGKAAFVAPLPGCREATRFYAVD